MTGPLSVPASAYPYSARLTLSVYLANDLWFIEKAFLPSASEQSPAGTGFWLNVLYRR